MKILREWKFHHYFTEYDKTEYFCPNCGEQEVWTEAGEGDYYMGSSLCCTACEHHFHIPNGTYKGADDVDSQIIRQIKSGTTNVPSTPRGS